VALFRYGRGKDILTAGCVRLPCVFLHHRAVEFPSVPPNHTHYPSPLGSPPFVPGSLLLAPSGTHMSLRSLIFFLTIERGRIPFNLPGRCPRGGSFSLLLGSTGVTICPFLLLFGIVFPLPHQRPNGVREVIDLYLRMIGTLLSIPSFPFRAIPSFPKKR